MKKFTLTISVFLCTLMLQANPFGSQLVVNSKVNSAIKVSLDHGPYSAPSSSVRFNNLQPGKHWIKIKKHHLGYGHGSQTVVFKGHIDIAPRSKTRTVVNRYGKFNIQSVKPLFQMHGQNMCGFSGCGFAPGHSGHHGNFQNNFGPHGNDLCGFNGCGLHQGHGGMHGYSNSCGSFYSQSYNNYGNTGWIQSGFGNFNYGMDAQQFGMFKQTLKNQSFESTRLRMAKQVISQNYFTTVQVSELMRLFNFDSKRLELAKHAYGRTIDKENYYSVSNMLSFNSSIDELMRFIGNG
ncbi:MAG: DUF4476 domain-containing protein [Bacteroidia bacterium]|nr:DUF4476 domain-containing protein [Bacteroidia bacterium]